MEKTTSRKLKEFVLDVELCQPTEAVPLQEFGSKVFHMDATIAQIN